MFIVFVPTQYAIQLQLLGGIWISQTVPTVVFGLYTNKLNPATGALDAVLTVNLGAGEVSTGATAQVRANNQFDFAGMNFNLGDVANALKLKAADSVATGVQRVTEKAASKLLKRVMTAM